MLFSVQDRMLNYVFHLGLQTNTWNYTHTIYSSTYKVTVRINVFYNDSVTAVLVSDQMTIVIMTAKAGPH